MNFNNNINNNKVSKDDAEQVFGYIKDLSKMKKEDFCYFARKHFSSELIKLLFECPETPKPVKDDFQKKEPVTPFDKWIVDCRKQCVKNQKFLQPDEQGVIYIYLDQGVHQSFSQALQNNDLMSAYSICGKTYRAAVGYTLMSNYSFFSLGLMLYQLQEEIDWNSENSIDHWRTAVSNMGIMENQVRTIIDYYLFCVEFPKFFLCCNISPFVLRKHRVRFLEQVQLDFSDYAFWGTVEGAASIVPVLSANQKYVLPCGNATEDSIEEVCSDMKDGYQISSARSSKLMTAVSRFEKTQRENVPKPAFNINYSNLAPAGSETSETNGTNETLTGQFSQMDVN
jgi:hypothetical protein